MSESKQYKVGANAVYPSGGKRLAPNQVFKGSELSKEDREMLLANGSISEATKTDIAKAEKAAEPEPATANPDAEDDGA